MKNDYITTYTKIHFTPFDPNPADVRIEDIAHALSLMTRANGHFKRFYSVAQHSINCANEARALGHNNKIQLACLLHDASEAYISDITRPVKKYLPMYQEIEGKLQSVIYNSFGIELTKEECAIVKEIDDVLLWHEFSVLMEESLDGQLPVLHSKPDFDECKFSDVEREFMRLFSTLTRNVNNHKCVGVDGTKGGWIAACLDFDAISVNFFDSINELCAEYLDADSVIIDIPIGLPESEADIRPDSELRKKLKGKASSVFSTPCRQAVYADNYENANAINNKVLGKGLSKQSFAICDKIREVDKFLQCNPDWQNRLWESHPEYVFAVLNAGQPVLENKKTPEGVNIRILLLKQYVQDLDEIINEVTRKPGMKRRLDDIIDALCLAVIGRLGMLNGFQTIPIKPELDSKGLKMHIVFAEN